MFENVGAGHFAIETGAITKWFASLKGLGAAILQHRGTTLVQSMGWGEERGEDGRGESSGARVRARELSASQQMICACGPPLPSLLLALSHEVSVFSACAVRCILTIALALCSRR